jgi:type IV pilus assembly protein PilC
MVESGIGLSEGLDCLARQASTPAMQSLLSNVSKSVQDGRSFSEAMQAHPRAFPQSLIALIRASEATGSLSDILRQSSAYMVKDQQTLRRIRTALAYPTFMLLMCLGAATFLLAFVLPKFASMYESRSAVLPAPTRLLMAVSDVITAWWYVWAGAAVIIAVAAKLWIHTAAGRRTLDRLLISCPVLAPLFNALHQSRAFHTLSLLIDAGVPLVEAIRIVQDVVPNSCYRELWQEVEEQVQVGERLACPLFEADFIDEPVAQMVDSGDKAGRLGTAFSRLAEFMEERYNRTITSTTQFMEPLMILIMGGLIGFVALSLMLPLFKAASVAAG